MAYILFSLLSSVSGAFALLLKMKKRRLRKKRVHAATNFPFHPIIIAFQRLRKRFVILRLKLKTQTEISLLQKFFEVENKLLSTKKKKTMEFT